LRRPLGEHLRGAYDDRNLLARLAERANLVAYEFENVPVDSIEFLAKRVAVFPDAGSLAIARDRVREKTLFGELSIPTSPFAAVDGFADGGANRTAGGAQDAHPRLRWERPARVAGEGRHRACVALPGGVPLILEGFVELRREVSILGVRGRSGETAFYPLAENVHRHGILPTSRSRPRSVRTTGAQLRRAPALPYGLCGVVAPELFDIGDTLLANEMAPRVHDSGHRTIEGAETSQFENHLRAILGLPLGGTAPLGHAAMVNFIGAMPEPARALAVPGALRPLSASPSQSNFLAQTGRRFLARYGDVEVHKGPAVHARVHSVLRKL
jgi:5-(carboxyamino)imidazole ribonucleotide synthase